ncbi:MAG TPA: TetR/AcrR family transcriptional regulator [Jatrophihabitans sp.]|jgi:AcrR family transcriptional regulator
MMNRPDTAVAREPQQDRSRATRQRLLAAAVQSLAELGWNGASVTVVAERAGVSRGATQHHFPTREDLFTAAVDYMSEVRLADYRDSSSRPARRSKTTEAAVSEIVGIYTGPLFRAALQVWVAASADPELRARVVVLEAKLARQAHAVALELLGADESLPGVRETVMATLDLARGLGLADLLTDDSRRRRQVVRQWARTIDAQLHPDRGQPVRPS